MFHRPASKKSCRGELGCAMSSTLWKPRLPFSHNLPCRFGFTVYGQIWIEGKKMRWFLLDLFLRGTRLDFHILYFFYILFLSFGNKPEFEIRHWKTYLRFTEAFASRYSVFTDIYTLYITYRDFVPSHIPQLQHHSTTYWLHYARTRPGVFLATVTDTHCFFGACYVRESLLTTADTAHRDKKNRLKSLQIFIKSNSYTEIKEPIKF